VKRPSRPEHYIDVLGREPSARSSRMNTLHWDSSSSDDRGDRASGGWAEGIERRIGDRRRTPPAFGDLYQRLEQKRGALEEERRRIIRRRQDRLSS
jgi:hypothetical protein